MDKLKTQIWAQGINFAYHWRSVNELAKRATVYTNIADKFSFLIYLELPGRPTKWNTQWAGSTFFESYPEDFGTTFVNELDQFHCYVKRRKTNIKSVVNTQVNPRARPHHKDSYDVIFEDGLQFVFLNVEIALRIFEFDGHKLFGRAIFFSAKTNKKNHLRSTMLQKKLSSLSLMCIESDVLW